MPGGVAEQRDEQLAVDGDVLGVVRDQVAEGDRQQRRHQAGEHLQRRALHVAEAAHQRREAAEERPGHQHQHGERRRLEELERRRPLSEIWVRNVFHAGVESSPSNDTETSRRSTKVTRLTCASNGTRRPPPKPRLPSVPKRNQPSRPQVAKSTEKSSPRSVHAWAPKSSPAAALTSAYTSSPQAVNAGSVAVPL